MGKLQLMLQQALVHVLACRRYGTLELRMLGALFLPHALSMFPVGLEHAPDVVGLKRVLDVLNTLVELLSEATELSIHASREIDQRTQSGEQSREHGPSVLIITSFGRRDSPERAAPWLVAAELPFIGALK